MNPAREYDPEKVRQLAIESVGDQFVDMYIMDIPRHALRKIFIKTKDEVDWDEVVAEGNDKISPYFEELFPLGAPAYPVCTTQGLKGRFVYVEDGLFE